MSPSFNKALDNAENFGEESPKTPNQAKPGTLMLEVLHKKKADIKEFSKCRNINKE